MPLVYIPDMEDYYQFMKKNNWSYVIMRNFFEFVDAYPEFGSKKDIDMLVQNEAVLHLIERYKNIPRRKGTKCDIHSANPQKETDFLGHTYYPVELAMSMLENRLLWKNKFYVPAPRDWYFSILYHITYHRAEKSGFAYSDPGPASDSRYFHEYKTASEQAGLPLLYTLKDAHECLSATGYGIDDAKLNTYITEQFRRHFKSYFFAKLCSERTGEMNLFVIRRTAVKHSKHIEIIKELKKRYKIIRLKRVSLGQRLTRVKHMRGGKWKRGGKPYIAVVVFDPDPEYRETQESMMHPFVFNSRQFFKTGLREWFGSTTTAKPNANPLHSTDNEAEAIGHLDLFFEQHEITEIIDEVEYERNKIRSLL